MYYVNCYTFFEESEKDWLNLPENEENIPIERTISLNKSMQTSVSIYSSLILEPETTARKEGKPLYMTKQIGRDIFFPAKYNNKLL